MKEFIELMTKAYRDRDKSLIEPLSEWLNEDCVIIGTSLDEISRGREGFKELLTSDFKYWVDIDISPAYKCEEAGAYRVYTLSAKAKCKFVVNDKCYERYIGYMKDIGREQMPEYAKAVKAIWELDHLIASKPGVRHTDLKPITIELLSRDDRICAVSFSFPRNKNHIDCFEGNLKDMDEDFASDRALLKRDDALTARFMETVTIDELRFSDVTVERHGDWFVGLGTLLNDTPIEDEIQRDFLALDEALTPYQKLYQFRKRLGETLWLYARAQTQKIMVRFFGVMHSEKAICVKHTYPFYWILED